jgi:hypothetical protein
MIAGMFALRRPDRLRSVVLLAPGGVVLRMSLACTVRLFAMLIPHRQIVKSYMDWIFADTRSRAS